MTATPSGAVVLGVSGDTDQLGSLRFAVGEADRLHVPVRLVHAVHQVIPPPPPGVLISYEALDRVADEILTQATEQCHRIGNQVVVETLARHENPVQLLVAASEHASMVVLQHRQLAHVERIFTGSTSLGVAARAHCPVVSVPAGWSPTQWGRVTVGVDDAGGPERVLAAAFVEAATREASLLVLHAWRLERPYADLLPTGSHRAEWEEGARKHLEDSLAPWRARHPHVELHVQVLHQWSAEALLEASATSDLLVLGRHSHRRSALVPVVGSLARTLVLRSSCPVEIVPEISALPV